MPVRTTPIAVYDLPITQEVTEYEEFPGWTDAIYSVQVRARVSGYLMNPVHFKDGDMVEENAKLFQIDPRQYRADLDRAEGTVKQYEAHVERLRRDYERVKNLKARAAVGQEEYDRYEGDYKEAVANLEVAKGNRDLARLNLEWTEVKAPISGMLSRRMVDPGNLIKADDTALTSIVSLDPLYVYFDVHEQAMLRIKRLMQEGKVKIQAQGGKLEVPVEIGLSDETDFPHKGLVDFYDNRVDANTGTLRLRAKIANPADRYGNRFIIPGLFVRVRLPIGEPHKALLIREQALVPDQGRKTVFVVAEKKDDKGATLLNEKGESIYLAQVRDVGTPGVLRNGYREIDKGVEPGDRVVVLGMQRLRPGIEVKVEKFDEKAAAGTAPGKAAEKSEAPRPLTTPAPAPAGSPSTDTAAGTQASTPRASLTPIAPINPPRGSPNRSRQGHRGGH
jgi:RND family efflux transporter MFP subunit